MKVSISMFGKRNIIVPSNFDLRTPNKYGQWKISIQIFTRKTKLSMDRLKYYSKQRSWTDDLEVDHLECVDRRVMDLSCACKFHLTYVREFGMRREEAIRRFAVTEEERLGLNAHLRMLDLSYQKEMRLHA